MLKLHLWIATIFLGFLAGCSSFGEEVDSTMIPPSAQYSPLQAPVYPPLNAPYTPNLLNDNNSRVMNIDRLNVGEANLPAVPQEPQPTDIAQIPAQNPSVDIYIKDRRNYEPNYVAPSEIAPYNAPVMPQIPADSAPKAQMPAQNPNVSMDAQMIQNSPILTPDNVIELSAVGMGVAPEATISPSQALALAKRAAIIDAYRQIGEKMYGIRLNAQDTVRDMVLINSVVKTKVEALIKNAEIIETVYKDGLCQITMELKLDGKVWHKILSSNI